MYATQSRTPLLHPWIFLTALTETGKTSVQAAGLPWATVCVSNTGLKLPRGVSRSPIRSRSMAPTCDIGIPAARILRSSELKIRSPVGFGGFVSSSSVFSALGLTSGRSRSSWPSPGGRSGEAGRLIFAFLTSLAFSRLLSEPASCPPSFLFLCSSLFLFRLCPSTVSGRPTLAPVALLWTDLPTRLPWPSSALRPCLLSWSPRLPAPGTLPFSSCFRPGLTVLRLLAFGRWCPPLSPLALRLTDPTLRTRFSSLFESLGSTCPWEWAWESPGSSSGRRALGDPPSFRVEEAPPRIWSQPPSSLGAASPICPGASWRTSAVSDAESDPRGLCEKTGLSHQRSPNHLLLRFHSLA